MSDSQVPRTLGQSIEVSPLEGLQGAATSAAGDGVRWLQEAIASPDASQRAVLYKLAADALTTAARAARDLTKLAKQGSE